jgi:ferric-dicitrate binding protein FerR (iron transport regulator)
MSGDELQNAFRELDLTNGWVAARDPAADLAALKARIARSVTANHPARSGRVAFPHLTLARSHARYVAIGATALLLGMFALLARETRFVHTPAQREYATAIGERKTISLSDGSRVILAPQSRLRVPDNFGATTTRTISLDGEAYFDVPAVSRAPFIVQTAGIVTRVLGTSFGVRRYATDSATLVAVHTGRVMSGGARANITLASGNTAIVTDSTATRSTEPVARSVAWTRDRLIFDGTNAGAMLTTLGRWYGYDFRLADSSLARVNVRAEFRIGDAADALMILKRVLHVTMTYDGNTITLHPRRRDETSPRRRDDTASHLLEVGK